MIKLEDFSVPSEYFYPEVRDGFLVTEMMKRFWAAQLVVLSEIERICKRHSINWILDMGSLIGCIRHKGFIPWDDDLDISMLRDDYEKFFYYARQEMPKEFCLLTPEDEPEYTLALGRVTNGNAINTSEEHMEKFYGCPYVTGIDIFPIDRLYVDNEKERDRRKRGMKILEVSGLIGECGTIDGRIEKKLKSIEKENDVTIRRYGNIGKDLSAVLQKVCSECRDNEATHANFLTNWLVEGGWCCPIEDYTEIIMAPFENTMVRIPAAYDRHLRSYYGDYMIPVRGFAAHDYPVYRAQEDLLMQKTGTNPYRYTFPKESFNENRQASRLKDRCLEMFTMIEKVSENDKILRESGNVSEADKLLEAGKRVEASLEAILESSYGKRIEENRKETLFLPCRKEWWNTMKGFYEEILSESDSDVYVIPLKYYDKNYKGIVLSEHDETELFKCIPELSGRITSFDEYDLEERHPDRIVIQLPYDDWGCMAVSEKYYSQKLLQYTDELVYIPPYDIEEPASKEDVICVAMKYIIEQPAVVYSDKVIVKSDIIRNTFIDELVELSGEEHRGYWEKKIVLRQ